VRRQSEAATALWIAACQLPIQVFRAIDFTQRREGAKNRKAIQSAVAASLCRRTPNLIVID